jgi:O-antigen/teichoic acid export membrane protein
MRATTPAGLISRAFAPVARALPGDSRATLAYLAGEAGGRGLGYLALVACAALLPVEGFGALSLYLTLVALLAIPSGLGLPAAIVRFCFRGEPLAAVLGTSALLGATSALALGAALWLLRAPLGDLVGLAPALVALAALGAPAHALRQAWLASLRGRGKSALHAASQFAEPALLLGALALLARRDAPLDATAVALTCTGATLALGIAGVVAWRRAPGLAFEPRLCAPLLRFALPLVAHAFAVAALAGFDQIVVSQTLGERATGIYGFAYRLGTAMQALCVGFSAWWTPRALELLASGARQPRLDALAQRSTEALCAAAVLLMFALPSLARWLGGARYAEGAPLVPIVVYGYLWFALYVFALGYLLHRQRTARIAIGSAAAMLATVALDYLLVPRFGLLAAALLTVAGYAALFASQWLGARSLAPEIRFGHLCAKVLACAPLAWAAHRWAQP